MIYFNLIHDWSELISNSTIPLPTAPHPLPANHLGVPPHPTPSLPITSVSLANLNILSWQFDVILLKCFPTFFHTHSCQEIYKGHSVMFHTSVLSTSLHACSYIPIPARLQLQICIPITLCPCQLRPFSSYAIKLTPGGAGCALMRLFCSQYS